MAQSTTRKIRFAILGAGKRADYYLRIATAAPELFEIAGVMARDVEKAKPVGERYGCRIFATPEELVEKAAPEFTIASVSWEANHAVAKRLVQLGMPVFAETPPGATLDNMLELWDEVQRVGGKVQVAEQVYNRPHHQAQLALVRSGRLGTITQAQVSVAHGYHGFSLMRKFLGIMYEPATITARLIKAPIMQGYTWEGPPREEIIRDSPQQMFYFDFDGKYGLFDFTYDQYWSPIRNERVLVRGERGEMINDVVYYMKDFKTLVHDKIVRHFAENSNHGGFGLKGFQLGEEWLYRNPLDPARLSEDEISGGIGMLNMGNYVRGGEEFYPLAEGTQDHYLFLMCQQALAEGRDIRTERMPWAL